MGPVSDAPADGPLALPVPRTSRDVAAAVARLVAGPAVAGAPLPGSGGTRRRWRLLRRLAGQDVEVGRLVEAHLDAVAVLAELAPAVDPAGVWGVWAAEPPGAPPVTAVRRGGGWALTGRKPWCSGASSVTGALVSAAADDGRRLFAVRVAGEPTVAPVPGGWAAAGMATSDTWSVDLDGAPAVAVGGPLAYLERPGFWHGAAGVAACWLGGADAVLRPLAARAAAGTLDPHGLAHLGAAAAAVHAAGAVLDVAADAVDADPADRGGGARLRALRARAVVEDAATTVVARVGRALGAAPLCRDAAHARAVEDLTVYLRQSHAERDLEQLGRLVGQRLPAPAAVPR